MLARQCHSAEWRERIFFPLSFAFFALARLLATVLFAEQMCWVAFLPALRAVCAARWLAPFASSASQSEALRMQTAKAVREGGRGGVLRRGAARCGRRAAPTWPGAPGAWPCPAGAPLEKNGRLCWAAGGCWGLQIGCGFEKTPLEAMGGK